MVVVVPIAWSIGSGTCAKKSPPKSASEHAGERPRPPGGRITAASATFTR